MNFQRKLHCPTHSEVTFFLMSVISRDVDGFIILFCSQMASYLLILFYPPFMAPYFGHTHNYRTKHKALDLASVLICGDTDEHNVSPQNGNCGIAYSACLYPHGSFKVPSKDCRHGKKFKLSS